MNNKYLSIRTKLILSLSFAVILFGTITSFVSSSHIIKIANQELALKGDMVLDILKNNLVSPVIINDTASINLIISPMQKMDSSILYVVVYNKSLNIIGHTFANYKTPSYLVNFKPIIGIQLFVDKQKGLYIQQHTAPINKENTGYVVVGFNNTSIVKNGKNLFYYLLGINFLFLLCIIVSVIFFSRIITKPIQLILKGFKEFIPGKNIPELTVKTNDEMKLLANGFKEMTERITSMDSEFKQTQQRIIESEKLAGIGTLASGIAHEINNPIAGIKICAHRLQKTDLPQKKYNEYVQLIIDSADHVKTIVQGLLTYARKPDTKTTTIDISAIILFALKLLHYRLEDKRIVVNKNFINTGSLVNGIRTQLIQVLINGLSNAIDASPKHGTISINLLENDKYYLIEIIDEGQGVEPTIANNVFDPFSSTKGSKGTGLGLFVTYNIVHAHGGSVSLTSHENLGAKLIISLPKVILETNVTFYDGDGI